VERRKMGTRVEDAIVENMFGFDRVNLKARGMKYEGELNWCQSL
jgi:hypothetical protein